MFESCYPYISPKFSKLTNLTALVINIDSHLHLENFANVAANLRVLKLWSDPKDTPFPARRNYEQVK